MVKEEYFKIEDTLKLIKIAKEDKKEGNSATITKDYIGHLSTNVNLMRESAEFEKKRILKLIEEYPPKDNDRGWIEKAKRELISKINANTKQS